MTPLGITVALGLLAGIWAQINVIHPQCDSPEVEEAALVAQDYINAHHPHGYKYALNRIEDIKIYTKPDGNSTYVLEVDLLETDCHVLDPTPVANCTVRPKILTAVEGDCDVVLDKVGGVLTVTAYKCKTEESTEDICLGCPTLLPLNDTTALDFVHASLATFNNITVNTTYTVVEVGRMSSQVVSGGPVYLAEYIIAEANCTDGACLPMGVTAATGICTAKGLSGGHTVDCKMFLIPNAARGVPPEVHTGNMPRHGLRHHKLTAHSGPQLSLLSAESEESAEVVPAVTAVADPAPAAADPAAADPAAADPAAADPAAADPAAADKAAADPAAADPAAADKAAADPAAADPAAADKAAADPAAADPAAADPAVDAGSASDSSTSDEVPLVVVKRDVPAAPASAAVEMPATQTNPIALVPVCPGRTRFF